jgi:hypothetical protein
VAAMTRIVAIDPGKTAGWAVGGGYLEASGTFDPDVGLQPPRDVTENMGWLRATSLKQGAWHIYEAYHYGLTEQIAPNAPLVCLAGCDHLIVEYPRLTKIGPGTFQDRADNLVVLCLRLGRIVQQIPHRVRTEICPQAWKGQVPKAIHNRRVLAELTHGELAVTSSNHNAIDAIGLYQYARKNPHT